MKAYIMTMFKHTITAISISIALSACNLAPKYEQPNIELPSTTFKYDVQQTEMESIQAASLGWKDYFADPRLHALIELAIQNNTDLRTANLNVEKFRTQYAISRNALLPSVGGNAGVSRSRGAQSENYSIGLGISSFELDLWGNVRNSKEAALEAYLAQASTRDATHLSIISSVAKAYFNEQAAQASMNLAERTLRTRQETYRLAQLRHKAGVISKLQLLEQESLIESAKSSYADAVNKREQARNALELLISQAIPEDLPKPLALDKQFRIRNLPAGLSSDLLHNRPDIIAAEYSLKAANANIGAARAAYFPRISLTSTLGFAHPQLSNLFESANKSWNYGASASMPIFDWGTTTKNVELSKIAQEKALVEYEAAIESAFRDVSNALVARAALNSQYESNVAQNRAAAERLRLTRLRYQHGVSSSLDLLDAERSSYAAESSVLQNQLSLLENLADLYKVLGGGLKRHTSDDITVPEQMDAERSERKTNAVRELKDAVSDGVSHIKSDSKKVRATAREVIQDTREALRN
ncbi:efflux transporter outer membrane subunit [Wielerella bovis]|uniref:efflux transporter outer membrane subunit n=1 Tax=Wielerella bovis TaxID=2917790 RepID=UPI0024B865AC|nr:TolC family protein [Wielerella bovis]